MSLQTEAQKIAAAIFVGVVALCVVFIGVMIYTTITTCYGTAHFQRIKELRRNGLMTAGWGSYYTGAAALLGRLPEWLLSDRTMTLTVSEILLNTGR